MSTRVAKIDALKPDMATIKEAASLVEEGGLVAFPTETVYGIACLSKLDSLRRLDRVKGRVGAKYYTLHIGQKGDAGRYVPSIGMKAGKLIERRWPGPLTIVFELGAGDVDDLGKSLDRDVIDGLYRDNSVGIRCPDNVVASMLLQEVSGSVAAPSANITGKPAASDAEGVLAQLDGQIDLVLDGGPCRYKMSSTVVRIRGGRLDILREGVYSQTELEEMSQVRFLFVCTGNTCRSPMAEGFFRRYLAEKLGIGLDGLEEAGYKVASAGVIDTCGSPASAEAVAVCAVRAVDISGHRSRPLSRQLIAESDFIFAMCRSHREQVVALSPEAGGRCMLLAGSDEVPDPIGQSQQTYDSCAEMIEEAVKERIRELWI
ncbi:MAG: L-threonylcarbamoyladenylate synthase [Planctomycetota bacterium]